MMTMPTIRVDDEVWRYLQSKARAFEDSPNDVLRREFGLSDAAAKPALPTEPNDHRRSELKPEKDYSHERISGFRLDGTYFPCRTFKEVLVDLSNHLRSRHGDAFDKIALKLHGAKRSYFSKTPESLKYAVKLGGNGLFVETNLNANLIVGICRNLVKELGYDLDRFVIA